jgi:hypothetical protein
MIVSQVELSINKDITHNNNIIIHVQIKPVYIIPPDKIINPKYRKKNRNPIHT